MTAAVPVTTRFPPGPEIPDDIVQATRQRYIDVYERITGKTWER